MDPCHTEVLIYKIHMVVVCVFPNLCLLLFRIQKRLLFLPVNGDKDVLC